MRPGKLAPVFKWLAILTGIVGTVMAAFYGLMAWSVWVFLSYEVKAAILALIFHALRVILVSLENIMVSLEPPQGTEEKSEE